MKRVFFLVLTAVLTALFVILMARDVAREWVGYQLRFMKTLQKEERRGVSLGIKQIIVKDLNRVDRCTTCHLVTDKPQLELARQPFRSHPIFAGVDRQGKPEPAPLAWHPIEKFGCTVCHGGQGLATEAKAAHGDVPHWEEPLLRGPLVQASCLKCHGNVREISVEAPLLAKGRELFKAKGCYGCHAIKEVGQTVSVDLGEVGSKSYQLMEADFEMMPEPHNRIHWIMTKLHNPRTLNPGVNQARLPPGEEEVFPSAMPNFGLTDEEAQALTVYLLSLTDANPPVSYTVPPEPEIVQPYATDVERGRAVFTRLGCAGCHGPEGLGGRRNWNGGLGEEVPSLVHVKAYYGHQVGALKELIRNGRQPVPRADNTRPNPGLYMPAWKDKMTDSELSALVAYLFSLADRLPQPPAPTPSADTAQAVEPAAPAPTESALSAAN